uniref:Uncharacterized protein n=1 Tax=Mesocestoides corti TaxID=53468 RepID=A0A5K3F794_MESCO
MSPAALILNSSLIYTDISLGLFSHGGLDVSACMTHTRGINTHAQTPHRTQRHQRS